MLTKLCSETKDDGSPCRRVALTGSTLCRHHQQLRRRSQRQQRARRTPTIRLSALQNHKAIQRNLARVARAIAANKINLDRAAGLIETLRNAAETLLIAEGLPADPDRPARS